MPKFRLIFELVVKTGHLQFREGSAVGRIIVARDLESAKRIAEAMIGEEIFRWQYLDKVIEVSPTTREPHISTFGDDYTWNRVLTTLGLAEGKTAFIMNKEGRKVGLALF